MDADRFDSLAKRLVRRTTRRGALGGAVTGGLLGALGIERGSPAVRAAQERCVLAFVATVRLGPSVSQILVQNGARPGELRGELSFSLSNTGNLENAVLDLPNGASLPVVGQATGHALQLRIELGERVALVVVGVGEEEVATCAGAIDGVATGPDVGDLGDWHAAALRQGEGGTAREERKRNREQSASGSVPAGGTSQGTDRGGRGERGGRERTPQSTPDSAGAGATTPTPAESTQGTGEAPPSPTSTPAATAASTPSPTATPAPTLTPSPTATPSPTPTPTSEAACPAGETLCSGRCVDVSFDDFHCGACGNACANLGVSYYCEGGQCLLAQCPAGTTDCGGYCADLMTSEVHCGGCGNLCGEGQTCEAGVCTNTQICPPGMVQCFGVCVDLATDGFNCGACGIACLFTQDCVGGACVEAGIDLGGVGAAASCAAGLIDCGGECVDLLNHAAHCGACFNSCPLGGVCQGGACGGTICPSGLTDCGGSCVDLSSSDFHCGACGIECALGSICKAGACYSCTAGSLPCTSHVQCCSGNCVGVEIAGGGFCAL